MGDRLLFYQWSRDGLPDVLKRVFPSFCDWIEHETANHSGDWDFDPEL